MYSLRGLYRILAENQAVRDRPAPQVMARQPNQGWVWDMTQLRSPVTYQCFDLYLVLDRFSRFIVGWLMAARVQRFQLQPEQLTVHSDNGGPLTAKPVAWLFSERGVQPSRSRPQVATDHPQAEAGFKTLQYHPTYPDRFDTLSHAQTGMPDFAHWYSWEPHHTALGLLTPAAVQFGTAEPLGLKRQAVRHAAYQALPERFSPSRPLPPRWPAQVGINAPKTFDLSGEGLSNDTKLLPPVSNTP